MKFPLENNWLLNGSICIKDEFWNPKLKTFFEVTLNDTFNKLERDGVLENYQNLIEGKLDTHKGCPWHDGLLYEAIRGAADYLRRGEQSDRLIARIDDYADIIERAQQMAGGGYLHTFVQLNRPEQRYGDHGGSILLQHDLYNQGGLFEAGVHYYLATGHVKLLECALRAANDLCDTIGEPPKKWVVPGHSLPEYALLELYELCVDQPDLAEKVSVPVRSDDYRALAHFWIHGRGHHEYRTNHPQYMGEYAQDHAPIERQVQAVGHAVRATLYYTGVTRLAMLENDQELLESSRRLWNNVEFRKMHINGGVGATHFEEKFGEDYDLVNSAYLETCASVGLIFWAEALSRATGEARYFNVIERALYNLMLSSVTLQGDHYFYRNPLVSDGSDHHWAWHGCPCCPPMIHKTFGMMDKLICAQDEDGLFVNLFVGGEIRVKLADGEAYLTASTKLPWEGVYAIRIEKSASPFRLRLRVPFWAKDIRYTVNGKPVIPEMEKGYAVFEVAQEDEIAFVDSLAPTRIEAHPYVRCDRGMVAIMRGPLVYCLEGVDNHGVTDVTLAQEPEFEMEHRGDLLGGVTIIRGKTDQGIEFTAVPLNVWDNRLAGEMRVWVRQEGKSDGWNAAEWKDCLYRPYVPTGRQYKQIPVGK